jgi:menaquinone-dependent protoporphyrinogen oxidase
MKILVAVASRHGATREIAEEIGKAIESALREEGDSAEVDVLFTDTVTSIAGYDGVILGSAVYMGGWLESAKKLVEANRDALRAVPVWLFSSGPVGEPPKPREDPLEVHELLATVHGREHRLFGGRIDKGTMRFAERAVATALRVKDGDYRDWPSIRAWARQIGAALHKSHSVA